MKLAVVTLIFGEFFEELSRLTQPSIKAYADKIGADYLVLTEQPDKSIPPYYAKYQVKNVMPIYDRIIWVDNDIIIRNTTPNLFNIVPHGYLGAIERPMRSWLLEQHSITFGIKPLSSRYFNNGLMVMDKEHSIIFEKDPIKWCTSSCAEQSYVNLRVMELGLPFYSLPEKYNFIEFPYSGGKSRLDADIIHYAGAKNMLGKEAMLKLVEDDIKQWTSLGLL